MGEMMKGVIYISMALLFLLPCYGAETIQMLNDSTPSYSMEVLEDGFAGYSVGDVISTFCVEKNETFYPGSSYYAVINDAAICGGVSGGNPDPLDERSAYLYTQYISGNPDFQDEEKLQNAIWFIEGEITSANSYVTLANSAVDNGDWSGIGNVRIANLYKYYDGETYSGYAQDQLIAIHPVPTPGALVLTGIGTILVGYLRRR